MTYRETLSQTSRDQLPLLGRVFLAAIFLMSGVGKIVDFDGTLEYMLSKGMTDPEMWLVAAIVVEVLGGLSLLIGLWGRVGAIALALFLVPVTAVFHNFWMLEGMEQRLELIQFMKNLAIIGGLLFVAKHGTGSSSADTYLRKWWNTRRHKEPSARLKPMSPTR